MVPPRTRLHQSQNPNGLATDLLARAESASRASQETVVAVASATALVALLVFCGLLGLLRESFPRREQRYVSLDICLLGSSPNESVHIHGRDAGLCLARVGAGLFLSVVRSLGLFPFAIWTLETFTRLALCVALQNTNYYVRPKHAQSLDGDGPRTRRHVQSLTPVRWKSSSPATSGAPPRVSLSLSLSLLPPSLSLSVSLSLSLSLSLLLALSHPLSSASRCVLARIQT